MIGFVILEVHSVWRKDRGASKENSRRPGRRKHWKPTLITSGPRIDWNESGDSQKEKALGISVTVFGLSPQASLPPSHHVLGALPMLGICLTAALGSYHHILPREKGSVRVAYLVTWRCTGAGILGLTTPQEADGV